MHIDYYGIFSFLTGAAIGLIKKQALTQLLSSLSLLIGGLLVQVELHLLKKAFHGGKSLLVRLHGYLGPIKEFLLKAEHEVVNKLSIWSQSVHWSLFWIVYFIGWTIFRQFIHPKWYNDSMDMLFITWTSAVVPFWVENSLKHSQGLQLRKQDEQMKLIEQDQELLIKLANLSIELGNKILSAVEQVDQDLNELEEKANKDD